MTRMALLREEDIYGYCFSDAAARTGRVHEIGTASTFPAAVLPVFEVCRATYFGAVNKGIKPGSFHDCWQDFVSAQWQYRGQGFPVTLASESMDPVNAADAFLEIGLLGLPADMEHEDVDHRDRRSEHRALTSRFREMQRLAVRRLECLDRLERRSQCEPPEYLPELDAAYDSVSDDLVLDTNMFLEVIDRLSLTEPIRKRPTLSDRFSRAAKERVGCILLSIGASGGLIIPANVVEEAERIARKKPNEYAQASKVLRAILTEPDSPLWSAFRMVPLSMDILGAFIQFEQLLSDTTPDVTLWPDFSDAVVLAHGLYYGCPVASAEWEDEDKPDWRNVDTHFKGLRI